MQRAWEDVEEFVSCNNLVLKVTAVLTSFNLYHLEGSGYLLHNILGNRELSLIVT